MEINQSISSASSEIAQLESNLNALRKEINDLGVDIARQSTELDNVVDAGHAIRSASSAMSCSARRNQLEASAKKRWLRADTIQTATKRSNRNVRRAGSGVVRA